MLLVGPQQFSCLFHFAMSELISVSFRSLDGKRVTLEIPSDIEISALKELLAEEFNVAPDQQRLIYRGRVIQGILGDYVKESGHTIHLVCRPAGSSPPSAETTPSQEPTTSQTPPSQTASIGQSAVPGMFVGSLRIERGSGSGGEPQVSITTDLPQSFTHALMSSFGTPHDTFSHAFHHHPFPFPYPVQTTPIVQPNTTTPTTPPTTTPTTTTPTTAAPTTAAPTTTAPTITAPTTTAPTTTVPPVTSQQSLTMEDAIRRMIENFGTTRAAPGIPVSADSRPFHFGIPVSHAQQHAEAVARAATQHLSSVMSTRTETGATEQPAAEQAANIEHQTPQPATESGQSRSTTTTFVNGTEQPSSFQVSVGALPMSDGSNWGTMLSSIMGQFAPGRFEKYLACYSLYLFQ